MNTTTNAQSQNKIETPDKEDWVLTNGFGIIKLITATEEEIEEIMNQENEWTEYSILESFEDNTDRTKKKKERKFQPVNFENLLYQHMELTAKYNELCSRFAEKAKQNEEKEKRIQATCEFIELCDVNKDGYVNYETRNIASRLIDGNITEDED